MIDIEKRDLRIPGTSVNEARAEYMEKGEGAKLK